MARLVGYRCVNPKCNHEDEEIFNDTEEKPQFLDRLCPKCGGKLEKWDQKSNCHRWNYLDRGGL